MRLPARTGDPTPLKSLDRYDWRAIPMGRLGGSIIQQFCHDFRPVVARGRRRTSMTYYGRRPAIINKYFYGRGQPYGCFWPCPSIRSAGGKPPPAGGRVRCCRRLGVQSSLTSGAHISLRARRRAVGGPEIYGNGIVARRRRRKCSVPLW